MRIKMKTPSKIIYGKISKKTDNVIFVNFKDFEFQSYNYELVTTTINEIKKIQNSSIDGIPLPKLFMYDTISLWWFFYPKLSRKLLDVISFIDNFLKFIEKEKPKIVVIENDFRNFEIIFQICQQNNIKLQFSKFQYKKYQMYQKIRSYARKIGINFFTKKKINHRKNLFNKKKIPFPSLEESFLFVSQAPFRRPMLTSNGTTKKGEFLIQNIIDLLEKKNKIIGIDIIPDLKRNNSALIERLNSQITWIPVELLFIKSDKSKHKQFLKYFKQIVNSDSFHNLFTFKNISYFDQVNPVFKEMEFFFYIPYWLDLIDSLNELFVNNKPKAVFLIYETGPYALAFISVCKKFGIKTIGMQHGTIYKHHFLYMHDKFSNSENQYEFPLPDKMILFGEYFKKLLISNGYPEDKLVSFGNPVFFHIDKIEEYMKNNKFYEKHGINKEKKIILFTTNRLQEGYGIKKFNYDTRVWDHLLANFANDDRYFLILKPHPREIPTIYEKMKKKYNASNAKIIQDDLLSLTYISSIVISTYSTATMDSICMKKPVINVEFDGIKYPIPLGDAVKTSQLEDVHKNILKILEDESIKSELLKNCTIFAKDHYNLPIERPYEILEELLNFRNF